MDDQNDLDVNPKEFADDIVDDVVGDVETAPVVLEFADDDLKNAFHAWFLDGGGEQDFFNFLDVHSDIDLEEYSDFLFEVS